MLEYIEVKGYLKGGGTSIYKAVEKPSATLGLSCGMVFLYTVKMFPGKEDPGKNKAETAGGREQTGWALWR